MQDADRNTKFFHLTTVVRRRRNKIKRLKDSNGDWVEDAEGMKRLAVKYFQGLFNQDACAPTAMPIINLFPSLAPADLEGLYKCVDLLEVKESLFGIGSLKALGANGFPACFYQNQWHICGLAIFNMVQQVFTDCQIPDKLNATLITLVPKVANPQTMI